MKTIRRISPYLYCLLSFTLLVIIGSILLSLPIAYKSRTSPVYSDALFMSASAVCVTGLSPFANGLADTLSLFGQIVTFVLMCIGGLGFITLYFFLLTIVGFKFGISQKFMLKENLNFSTFSGLIKFLKRIVIIAASIIIFGTLLFSFTLVPQYGWGQGLWLSLYHAASSFNNCGLDLFGNNSLIGFHDNYYFLTVTMLLIIVGGIGFPVLIEIGHNILQRRKYLSVYSKIVLITTSVLIITGTLFFYFFDYSHITFFDALFESISCRTAGFCTFDQSTISFGGRIIAQALMFIGASSMSTGGGVKVTTIAVIIILVVNLIKGRDNYVVFKRKIPVAAVSKSMITMLISILTIFGSFVIVYLIESSSKQEYLDKILFECFSSYGTVGLSLGITPTLSIHSKIVLTFVMLFGRIGPLTLTTLFTSIYTSKEESHIDYVEENIIVG